MPEKGGNQRPGAGYSEEPETGCERGLSGVRNEGLPDWPDLVTGLFRQPFEQFQGVGLQDSPGVVQAGAESDGDAFTSYNA